MGEGRERMKGARPGTAAMQGLLLTEASACGEKDFWQKHKFTQQGSDGAGLGSPVPEPLKTGNVQLLSV